MRNCRHNTNKAICHCSVASTRTSPTASMSMAKRPFARRAKRPQCQPQRRCRPTYNVRVKIYWNFSRMSTSRRRPVTIRFRMVHNDRITNSRRISSSRNIGHIIPFSIRIETIASRRIVIISANRICVPWQQYRHQWYRRSPSRPNARAMTIPTTLTMD